MKEKINICMGQMAVVGNPHILEALGIGSCVVICLFDRRRNIAGMAHAMLGRSESEEGLNPIRFADKAIDAMLRRMFDMGGKREDIRAKMFGGASLFSDVSFKTGEKNIKATKEKLRDEGIMLVGKEVGGNQGRSIWFDTETGKVVVGRVFSPTKEV